MPGASKLLFGTSLFFFGLAGSLFGQVGGRGGSGAGIGSLGASPGSIGASSGSAVRGGRPVAGTRPAGFPQSPAATNQSPQAAGSGAPAAAGSPAAARLPSRTLSTQNQNPRGSILYPGTPDRQRHGNILSPGSPGSSIPHTSILTPGTPGGGLGAVPGQTPGPTNILDRPPRPADYPRHRFRQSIIVAPYLYPIYLPYYTDSSYVIEVPPATTQSSSQYVVQVPPGKDAGQGQSRIYEVGPAGPEEPAGGLAADETDAATDQPVLFLIALKGGLIYASEEHWLEGSVVHFITPQGDHHVVALNEIDLQFSAKVNRERGLRFVLEVREGAGGVPDEGYNP